MAAKVEAARTFWRARAKVNLYLHILGRDLQGWHGLDSLVAFAGCSDWLSFAPGSELSLSVNGPSAAAAGAEAQNLVLRAALALGERVDKLRFGHFQLTKYLPVAAGLGGGSADAAAALRALAHANGLSALDPRVVAAAIACGADVAVCLAPTMRLMRGRGEQVGPALSAPPLIAVLVNPGVGVSTPGVFAALALPLGAPTARQPLPPPANNAAEFRHSLQTAGNDLQRPALQLAPEIAGALGALADQPGAWLARMSGSGATCFALLDTRAQALAAAGAIGRAHPHWWVRATILR